MDFSLSPEETRFRDEVRDWLRDNLDDRIREHVTGDDIEQRRAWQRRVHEAGFAGVSWPRELGGQGGTLMQEVIVNQEMAAARAPDLVNIIGLYMAGPTILAHGTLLRADEIWCQGFSEPNSGSDLASLRTRAAIDGDDFVVSGQKVWTSFAHVARWCILLTRTDASETAHAGLTYLIVDMHSPGIEVRPLRQITGDAEFNEMYFTDVRVPRANLLGEVGGGWRVAMTTLMHERATLGVGLQVRARIALDALRALARETVVDGVPRSADPLVRQQIAQLSIEVEAMRLNGLRGLTKVLHGEQPGPEGSVNKLMWSELNQRIAETALDLLGPYATLAEGDERAPLGGRWAHGYLRSRANSIEGGTSEVLRNILAERVLGLPRSR
ncbi:MAG: acyl-CoA dehydrogenase [Chloroflexi bacterium]|nr:MAG: acyl-CoA dehydrogenase [Chloroflexota bacterium]